METGVREGKRKRERKKEGRGASEKEDVLRIWVETGGSKKSLTAMTKEIGSVRT
jgi:hypothetical protein